MIPKTNFQNYTIIPLEEKLKLLSSAKEWLENKGIILDSSRFDEVLFLLQEIVNHQKFNQEITLLSKYDRVKLNYTSFAADSFIKIYTTFKNEKSHNIPRKKLKSIVGGPFLSWDENSPQSSESRNLLFELEIAAIFKDAGFKITGFDDVDFRFKHFKINVQCKRLHSEKNVEYNIKSASKQIAKRINNKKNAKGIIALSINKMTGTEDRVMSISDKSDIGREMENISELFIRKHSDKWTSLININVIGVLLFFQGIAVLNKEGQSLQNICNELAIQILPSERLQTNDYLLMQEISHQILEMHKKQGQV